MGSKLTESRAGIQRAPGHSAWMLPEGLGSWTSILLSRGRPHSRGPRRSPTLRSSAVQDCSKGLNYFFTVFPLSGMFVWPFQASLKPGHLKMWQGGKAKFGLG